MANYYSVVQYVPDVVAGERVNIGVVVFGAGQTRAHFINDWRRVKQFATADVIDELKDFGRRAKRLGADDIRAAATRRQYGIQFTPPAGSLLDADALVFDSARRFLIDPPREPARGHLVKSKVAARAKRHLRDALLDRLGGSGPLLLKSDYMVAGRQLPHGFDLAVANGRPYYAAEAVSFQGPDERQIDRAIDAAAFAVEDVKRSSAFATLPLAVIVARPSEGDLDRYARAERTFADAGAEVVPADQVDAWAARVAGLIPA